MVNAKLHTAYTAHSNTHHIGSRHSRQPQTISLALSLTLPIPIFNFVVNPVPNSKSYFKPDLFNKPKTVCSASTEYLTTMTSRQAWPISCLN